jgi:phthiodiolone/phenolphthiodiolone dimycocerosates ketoreductase
MVTAPVETSIPIIADRHFPPAAFGQAAAAMDASGCVDYFQVWDQLTSWYPQGLWTPENTPLATVMPDCDSFHDVWIMAGNAAASAPNLGIVLSVDAIRRGPAELTQSALTLADLTGGKAIVQLGAGEIKQARPFGWRRAQGIKRLEDFYRIYQLLMDNDEPVSFEGHHTTLRDAWIGTAKANRPHLWGLGGGEKIIDLATSYADGFCTVCPFAWTTPERVAEQIAQMKAQLERKGRDPEKFRFGVWATMLLHEDQNIIDKALDNKLTRWLTAIAGRMSMADWRAEGIEPPFPDDWHYAIKMLPMSMSTAEVEDWASRASRQMAEKSYFLGTPADAAKQLQPYIEAGIDYVAILDMLAFVLDPQDARASMSRSIQTSAEIKALPLAKVR